MSKQSWPKMNMEFRKLIKVFMLTYALIILLTSISIFQFYKFSLGRLANSYTSAARNSIITREYRNAIAALAPAITDAFTGLTLYNENDVVVFSIPYSINEQDAKYTLLIGSISKPLFSTFDSNSGPAIGQIIFRYSLLWPLLMELAFSVILLAVFSLLFLAIRKRITERYEFLIQQNQLEVAQDMARQVAHDIRSPLSALNMISSGLTGVSEEKRLLIRRATQRINDIANDLLHKGKITQLMDSEAIEPHSTPPEPVMVSAIIDNVISEKRIQYRNRPGLNLEAQLQNSYGLFIMARHDDLARVISNLINNAVEACATSGSVVVSVSEDSKYIDICVQDNGKGMTKDIVTRVRTRGFSSGKKGSESGSGLGLFHANQTVQAFGGTLEIDSKIGSGTTIHLKFPRAQAPEWFVEALYLPAKALLVSVDDDPTIHKIWAGRLTSLGVKGNTIEHISFLTLTEFMSWIDENSPTDSIFLVDFEFLNESWNGLQAIEKAGVSQNSILVTSRHDDPLLIEQAKKLGVKLIPKPLAPLVPIEIKRARIKYDACLIDDDSLIHLTWQMAAKNADKSWKGFTNPKEFFREAEDIDTNTPIYVDVNLGNGVRGENIANALLELGFTKVALATGYDSENITSPSKHVTVVGKEPPF